MVSVLVSVGAVTWCGVMHRAALDKGPAGAERQEVATSCNSVRFGAQTSKGIRNPMLYPLELRAHRMCIQPRGLRRWSTFSLHETAR